MTCLFHSASITDLPGRRYILVETQEVGSRTSSFSSSSLLLFLLPLLIFLLLFLLLFLLFLSLFPSSSSFSSSSFSFFSLLLLRPCCCRWSRPSLQLAVDGLVQAPQYGHQTCASSLAVFSSSFLASLSFLYPVYSASMMEPPGRWSLVSFFFSCVCSRMFLNRMWICISTKHLQEDGVHSCVESVCYSSCLSFHLVQLNNAAAKLLKLRRRRCPPENTGRASINKL